MCQKNMYWIVIFNTFLNCFQILGKCEMFISVFDLFSTKYEIENSVVFRSLTNQINVMEV